MKGFYIEGEGISKWFGVEVWVKLGSCSPMVVKFLMDGALWETVERSKG